MLNRTFAGLTIIMPEARPVGNFDPTKTRIGNFAMSGGDGRQLDVNVDGGDNKDNVVGSLIQNFAYESIQEFQVLQHRWTAESGRSVGGVVNVISKSGTNQLRGSVFGSYRGDNTRTMDFFEKQRQEADSDVRRRPSSRAQEFGGSIGGPIMRGQAVLLRRLREVPRALEQRADAGGVQPAAAPSPAREVAVGDPDALRRHAADGEDRLAASAPNQTLFARFAYQDQSSPNDQIPVPATADLNNGNTNTTRNYDFVASHTWTLGRHQAEPVRRSTSRTSRTRSCRT